MIESLVITLREGIEAALVLGIVLTYLKRTGRLRLSRYVYIGLGLAVVASLAVGVILQIVSFDPENEFLEGTLLGIGGLFVASMVFWMWRTARNLRRHMESRLESITSPEGKDSRSLGVGLLAFTFFMVFREGAETVLFLTAATLGEANVLNFIGGTLGLALATLFAFLFIRGSLRINLSRFFTVTSIVLLILALKLLAGSIHEFAEVQLLPMSKEIMRVLGYLVRDESSTAIMMGLIALPILLVLWDYQRPRSAALPGESSVERRKRLSASRLELMWRIALSSASFLIILTMATTVFAKDKFYDPSPIPVAATSGQVLIPVASIEEGRLYKYSFMAGDTPVRFLAVRQQDGSLSTALDACLICGSVGYMQEGGNAICKNCNAPIPWSTLALGGGCNPLPLPSREEGPNLVIPSTYLTSEAYRFR